MIIDCISDLHGSYPQLEGGDLLIVAGDLTAKDTPIHHFKFQDWLFEQKYSKKILIGGNHDNWLQEYALPNTRVIQNLLDMGIEYLCDSGTGFEGLKIWGSPWTKTFKGMNPHCKAFTCDTDLELEQKWALIPDEQWVPDILITHSPPWGIGDLVTRESRLPNGKVNHIKEHVGSPSLEEMIQYWKPKLHVFGHIHEGYGMDQVGDVICVNASHVNERYKSVNKPIRVIL